MSGDFEDIDGFRKLHCWCDAWEVLYSQVKNLSQAVKFCPFCGAPVASTKKKWESHSIRERKRRGSWFDEGIKTTLMAG